METDLQVASIILTDPNSGEKVNIIPHTLIFDRKILKKNPADTESIVFLTENGRKYKLKTIAGRLDQQLHYCAKCGYISEAGKKCKNCDPDSFNLLFISMIVECHAQEKEIPAKLPIGFLKLFNLERDTFNPFECWIGPGFNESIQLV